MKAQQGIEASTDTEKVGTVGSSSETAEQIHKSTSRSGNRAVQSEEDRAATLIQSKFRGNMARRQKQLSAKPVEGMQRSKSEATKITPSARPNARPESNAEPRGVSQGSAKTNLDSEVAA